MRAFVEVNVKDVEVMPGRRDISEDAVSSIMKSLPETGLMHPIGVRYPDGEGSKPVLVYGRNRLEAMRRSKWDKAPAHVVEGDETDARKAEIAENLHRAELTVQERAEQIAEWIRLTEVSAQLAPKPLGGRPESGINAAARELGVERTEAQRAVKVASISEQAKQAAIEEGLDNNQSALLIIAKEKEPAKQVAKVLSLSAERDRKAKQRREQPRRFDAPITPVERSTSLDSPEEQEALSKLPPEVQARLKARAGFGEYVSAIAETHIRKINRSDEDHGPRLTHAETLWHRACDAFLDLYTNDRDRFVAWCSEHKDDQVPGSAAV
jgi:ParB-like chromosome segregation protein Spo0J